MAFNIRKARVVLPPPAGAQIRVQFALDPNVRWQHEERIKAMPVEDAIERIQREISRLRGTIEAAADLPDSRTLAAQEANLAATVKTAYDKWTLLQRRYHGGTCDIRDVEAAQNEAAQAQAHRREVQGRLQKRVAADDAQAALDAILQAIS